MTRARESVREEARRIPLAEWLVAAIGLVLLVGSLAVVLLHEIRGSGSAPAISVRVTDVTPSGGRWLVEFMARNDGDQTAADVEIVGTLAAGAAQPEESRAVLDYVSGHSTSRGGLYFSRDPRAGALELRASGYRRP